MSAIEALALQNVDGGISGLVLRLTSQPDFPTI